MNRTIRSIDLPTGVTLQYVEQGDPKGLPAVLLHGASDSWRSYELVLPHLPQWISAIAVTQRGHGDTSRPTAGYRSRGLVLAATRSTWYDHPDVRALAEAVAGFEDPVDPVFVREFQRSTLAQPVSPQYVETVVATWIDRECRN